MNLIFCPFEALIKERDSGLRCFRDGFKGDKGDMIVKRIFLMTRIYHPSVIEVKILKRDMH